MSIRCQYCHRRIEIGWFGWGYYIDEMGPMYWHTECLEITEGVLV